MPATVAYSYLGLNNVVRADDEDPDVRWDLITGSGANPYAGLDRFGRVTDCLWRKYSTTAADLARLKYGYNRDSSRLWRQDTVASAFFDELYAYDSVQRLTAMDRGTLNGTQTAITSTTLAQDWTLDPTGNWKNFQQTVADAVTQTRTSNQDNEITHITNSVGGAWTTPVYNDGGDMLGMPNAGSTATPARIATYDAWGRLVAITSGFNTAATFVYDGLNRRVIKNTYTSGSITATRHYYYSDQWQVLEERVGSATVPERQYVWGLRYVDDLALRDRDTNGDGTLDERMYAMQDANWNVVAICNGSAVVQERYAYTPYGMVAFLNPSFASIGSSSAFAWNYLFTGRERDTESALQLNRNRYYHSRLGSWITRDPMGHEPGDTNLYRYVRNRPLVGLDPRGLQCCLYIWNRDALNVGHAALECGGSYMSFWPDPAPGETVGPLFRGPCTSHSYADDVAEEGRAENSKTCLSCNLNEAAILKRWQQIQAECRSGKRQFCTLGANCSSTVGDLLAVGVPPCNKNDCSWWNPFAFCENACGTEPWGIDRPSTVKSYFDCYSESKCNPNRAVCCLEAASRNPHV